MLLGYKNYLLVCVGNSPDSTWLINMEIPMSSVSGCELSGVIHFLSLMMKVYEYPNGTSFDARNLKKDARMCTMSSEPGHQ